MAKKNRMSVSCEVEDEINFKAICDTLIGGVPITINGTHSRQLVKLMKRFYKENKKKLTQNQIIIFNQIKEKYLADKHNNGIY